MMRRALLAGACVLGFVGCSLFVGLDGLSDGAADAQVDAAFEAASESSTVEASADAGVDAREAGCPSGRGPAMVTFDGHCIDSTEVTYQQYISFLADVSDGGASLLPPVCSFKTSFVPNGNIPMDLTYPVANVDWCDAYAYCTWAGKELCGGFDGGAIAANEYNDASVSLWMAACTERGVRRYPYGGSFDSKACNIGWSTADASGGSVDQVAKNPNCVGGFPGIFDMVGNIKEWENACNPADGGPNAQCRRRGGGFNSNGSSSADCKYDELDRRDYRYPSSGIRCCAHVR